MSLEILMIKKRKMKYNNIFFSIPVICFLFLTSFNLFAQDSRDRDRSVFYEFGRKFYCDAVAFPNSANDSVKIIIMFRIPNTTLTFRKTELNNMTKGEFFASPNIDIEFRDEDGIIRKRDSWHENVYANNYDEVRAKNIFTYGTVTTYLNIGKYKLTVELTDENMSNLHQVKTIQIEKKNFFNEPTLSQAVYAEMPDSTSGKTIYPYVLDYGISFSGDMPKMFIVQTTKIDNIKYNYKCDYIEQKVNNIQWEGATSFEGTAIPVKNMTINTQTQASKNFLSLALIPFKNERISNNYQLGYLQIDLPGDKMVPGTYEMKIWDNNKDTSSYKFRVEWADEPLSLINPEYAAEMMYYILTDDEYKDISKGSPKDILKKILNYWKKYDPDPTTLYNETMTEYFRRVDYAFFNFQTYNDKDGAKTDRGKIYILYGPPSKTERNLIDGQTEEIWRYDHLKQEYVFQTNPSGSFKLKKINQL